LSEIRVPAPSLRASLTKTIPEARNGASSNLKPGVSALAATCNFLAVLEQQLVIQRVHLGAERHVLRRTCGGIHDVYFVAGEVQLHMDWLTGFFYAIE